MSHIIYQVYLMVIDEAREEDRQNDACVHDDGKDHGPKTSNGLKNEYLANRVAHRKDHHMHVHFRVARLDDK